MMSADRRADVSVTVDAPHCFVSIPPRLAARACELLEQQQKPELDGDAMRGILVLRIEPEPEDDGLVAVARDAYGGIDMALLEALAES